MAKANVNSRLRKLNKEFVDKIKEDSKTKQDGSTRGKDECFAVDTRIQQLTLKEQLFKGNNITVAFIGAEGEKENLSNLQLVIFINNKLKYASKKGVFTLKTIKKSVIKRSGWRVYCETVERDRLVFKDDKNYEKFIGFCTQLRDCVRLQELYHATCYDFVENFQFENEIVVENEICNVEKLG